MEHIEQQVQKAAEFFWNMRTKQGKKEEVADGAYVGRRAQVTGGKQLDGFVSLLEALLLESGVSKDAIFTNADLELPGFYRATKKWDLLVVREGRLEVAIELKSQVGPSFSNNFNNRTEEAMGSALDIWTAYREGAFGVQSPPWLGYLMVLEDCEKSSQPVRNRTPHFSVFPEFDQASYQKRYEIFCKKLMLERQYTHTCFLTTKQTASGVTVNYPNPDLSFACFAQSMLRQVQERRIGETGCSTKS
ncbi:MAG: PaeR7I family type II restriction endonuclease [Lachnospiraceae bacterium]